MNHTLNFNGRAKDYAIGRPAYAPAFVEYLYARQGLSPSSIIADIGAGTGKLTKQLLERGSFVYCVEPNDDMRNVAIQELSGYQTFCPIAATAEASTLPDASVDFVMAAQAFHWFDVAAFRRECKRILKPNGKVFLIWNRRDPSAEVNAALAHICARYCPNFKGFSNGTQNDDTRIKQFFHNAYAYNEFENPLLYDRKGTFIHRCLSSSYSLKEGDANYQRYVEKLSALFERYGEHGVLKVPNITVSYSGVLLRHTFE